MAVTTEERFWNKIKVTRTTECWLWQAGVDGHGYGVFNKGKGTRRAHRIALMFLGAIIPVHKIVCHHCDNVRCCNPNHLYIGTTLENVRDKMERGRHRVNRGQEAGGSKLKNEDVYKIRERLKNGERGIDLAVEFHVSQQTICGIKKRHRWNHI